MFIYVASHLLNHAAGIISLEAANDLRVYMISPWTTVAGIVLLAVASLFHLGSALWVIYIRRSLRMPIWQWSQMVLGLMIPLLLIEHAMATAGARLVYDMQPDYRYILAIFFHFAPQKGWIQLVLLVVAWGHACIGIHHWLKVRDWYPDWRMHLYGLALLIPSFSLAGMLAGGLEVRGLVQDPIWSFDMLQSINYPGGHADAFVTQARDYWWIGYLGVLLAVLAARQLRIAIYAHRQGVRVTYPSGRRVLVPQGGTLLETSRKGGIPHASVCGGRGRCSTCRVMILGDGAQMLDPPSPVESRILKQLQLPPNVRLACQVRPSTDLTCEPLLPPDVTAKEALSPGKFMHGQEMEIAVMFADLRGFTQLSETRLPFDVVFMLNQYFRYMGTAIEQAGGRVDKFIGDGIMALFGIGSDADVGVRQALNAAKAMSAQLELINERLANDLEQPLRLGIGIHAGHAIVGTMGHGDATQITAIGDTVNTASRLEAMTKEHEVQLLVSDKVSRHAGVALDQFPTIEISLRGRRQKQDVHLVQNASDLPDIKTD